MANGASEGHVYRIDLNDGKGPHYWLVLTTPRMFVGTFATVSFTDRHNIARINDVWETGYLVCPTLQLSKPSVVALRHARIGSQTWLNEQGAQFVDSCTAPALARARGNFCWYTDLLPADVRKFVQADLPSWTPDNDPPAKPPPQ